ncbi:hypothetical protein PZE06_20830 [Robertmurraya sp. DFI.2.37]|uniref:hypothetical protein n=1 Tax=Robertmurraya sp. DFI.2.37 TaxID=3031819 RepID=UPI0012458705|nr:hypothetical protein [Robertmurraya sp. DFI.2.37]MDF1510582.1 hypothetical protein [Robertmurraya sp. DFI.2.37]
MSWTEKFINALEEWDARTPSKRGTINDNCFLLGYAIGIKDMDKSMSLFELKNRIDYLVREVKIAEEFLINSLIQEMSKNLNSEITNHGEAIINSLNVNRKFQEKHGETSDNFSKHLDRLTDVSYTINAEECIDIWNEIVNREFSLRNCRDLRNKEFQKGFKDYETFYSSLSEEEKNKTFGELREKDAE